jgi:hypothetical protein
MSSGRHCSSQLLVLLPAGNICQFHTARSNPTDMKITNCACNNSSLFDILWLLQLRYFFFLADRLHRTHLCRQVSLISHRLIIYINTPFLVAFASTLCCCPTTRESLLWRRSVPRSPRQSARWLVAGSSSPQLGQR